MRLVNSVTKVAMKYERLYGEIWKCLASGLSALKFLKCTWMLKNYAFPSNTYLKLPAFSVSLCKYRTFSRWRQWGIYAPREKLINIRLSMFTYFLSRVPCFQNPPDFRPVQSALTIKWISSPVPISEKRKSSVMRSKQLPRTFRKTKRIFIIYRIDGNGFSNIRCATGTRDLLHYWRHTQLALLKITGACYPTNKFRWNWITPGLFQERDN